MTDNTVEIRLADWNTERDVLAALRRRVFIDEQNVPEELEWDDQDALARHYLVILDGEAIATARLTPISDHEQKIGRMAVLTEYRGRGFGRALLDFVIQDARTQAADTLVLHAQVSAVGFYRKAGFTCVGDIFDEAGIPHQAMQMTL
jgi:predicted GNAT family N-acyltransferase